jgi:two-component system response regulator ChvI
MPQTIALVDDDRNILTSVSMTLEQEGYLVRTYTDGESALQGLMSKPADLAVLDVKMPRMDGMELLQRLRARSAMPVIFLTSKDEEVDEVMGLRLGADDYITKPFSQRLLLERIRALLRRNEATRAEANAAPGGRCIVRGDLCWTRPSTPAAGGQAGAAHRHGIPAGEGAAHPPRHGEEPRPADRRRLWREHLRGRPHHRQPRQARAQEVPRVDDDFAQIETLYGIGYRYKEQ